jgi:hypothetical protein
VLQCDWEFKGLLQSMSLLSLVDSSVDFNAKMGQVLVTAIIFKYTNKSFVKTQSFVADLLKTTSA